ncbi:type II CAAX endopeptidase family protein [Leptolyngbya sp. FACHB-17]|uniref:CPBP family intramembrane glutamic endopeptidase n=1 Tax=unclassified Leptolyngbya TaxID=2650499 RepID=UPI00168105CB|nr:type II CAAX endopeptidase family protein [Leptolyngbya sp. FACHB-17]MBD2078871.1 CPBP family intramembrane metalloprotease [Leptolyngbya sp. FACHB-17]
MMQPSENQRSYTANLFTYCLIAFGWSWLCWLCANLCANLVLPFAGVAAAVLGILASFGPSLAAIVLSALGSSRIRAFLTQSCHWRVSWIWYGIAFLLPAAIMGIVVGLHLAFGGTLPPSSVSGRWLLAVLNFILVLLIGGPLGEEFGWRGYLLPRLQRRFNALWASLILGIIWSTWHLPLFFTPGTVQQQLPIVLFFLNTTALSILFTWLFNRTDGSVVIAIVLHTAVNGWAWVFPIFPKVANSLRPYSIATVLLWSMAIVLSLVSLRQSSQIE